MYNLLLFVIKYLIKKNYNLTEQLSKMYPRLHIKTNM